MLENQVFINMVLFQKNITSGLKAVSKAGFESVEFFEKDLTDSGFDETSGESFYQQFKLKLIDLQLLTDFDGAPGDKRLSKRAEAIHLLQRTVEVGAKVLAVTASTDPDSDQSRVKEDLEWLVNEAAKRNVRLSYEPMSWSTTHSTLVSAWNVIKDLNPDVIGLVVDSYHIFSKNRTADDLESIPPHRIISVQLNDAKYPIPEDELKEVARSRRLFPGEGDFPILSLISKLNELGYEGPIGLEVFNDEYAADDMETIAVMAMDSIRENLNVFNF